MPAGVESVVQDGLATIEFVDHAQRGVGLARLLEFAPADQVQKVTRPRPAYVVPERYARAAGLLDAAGDLSEDAGGDDQVILYPEGDPSDDWRRDELDAYALEKHQLDTTSLGKKSEVLAAIAEAKA